MKAALIAAIRAGVDLASGIQYLGPVTKQGKYGAYVSHHDYAVRLYGLRADGAYHEIWTRVSFNGTVAADDPSLADGGEFWALLFQRAFLERFGDFLPGFSPGEFIVNPGQWQNPKFALAALIGRVPIANPSFDLDPQFLADRLLTSAVIIGTREQSGLPANEFSSGLIQNHAYGLISVEGSGPSAILALRNTWGQDENGSARDGVNDGLVQLRWSDIVGELEVVTWVNVT